MAKTRQSNFELLRIVSMFLILTGHYIGHSGFPQLYDYSAVPAKMLFLQFIGEWGKTAINAFVLITGYFMCTSVLTPKRLLKLIAEAYFYYIIGFVVFILAGEVRLSIGSTLKLLCWPLQTTNVGFTTSFLWFYLFIPFYNVLIANISRRQLYCLIGCFLLMFTVSTTFFFNTHVFHYVVWYMVLYLIGASIRLYPLRWMDDNRICVPLLAISFAFALMTIIGFDLFRTCLPFSEFTHFLCQSDRLAALAVGTSLFLVFKNLHVRYSGPINAIASTCFGVLLIHANSNAMRKWLWQKMVDSDMIYSFPLLKMMFVSIAIPVVVFAICSAIDFLRIKFIETPFLTKLQSRFCWLNAPLFGLTMVAR